MRVCRNQQEYWTCFKDCCIFSGVFWDTMRRNESIVVSLGGRFCYQGGWSDRSRFSDDDLHGKVVWLQCLEVIEALLHVGLTTQSYRDSTKVPQERIVVATAIPQPESPLVKAETGNKGNGVATAVVKGVDAGLPRACGFLHADGAPFQSGKGANAMPAHLTWPFATPWQRDRLSRLPSGFYDASRRHFAPEAQVGENYVSATEFGKGAHGALDLLVRVLEDAHGLDVLSKLILAHV